MHAGATEHGNTDSLADPLTTVILQQFRHTSSLSIDAISTSESQLEHRILTDLSRNPGFILFPVSVCANDSIIERLDVSIRPGVS